MKRRSVIQATVSLALPRMVFAQDKYPGKAIAFIVDEMGQYVARSGDRLENLRAVVEQFGKESLRRLKAKTIPSSLPT